MPAHVGFLDFIASCSCSLVALGGKTDIGVAGWLVSDGFVTKTVKGSENKSPKTSNSSGGVMKNLKLIYKKRQPIKLPFWLVFLIYAYLIITILLQLFRFSGEEST